MNKQDVLLKLQKSRTALLFDCPFMGQLVLSLDLVDATDAGWCPTAATDGKRIYYNCDFLAPFDELEIEFVLCHEVIHVMHQHLERRGNRDPIWMNMAADYVTNGILIESKIGKMPTILVGKKQEYIGLYDKKYSGWSTEEVYDDLKKNNAPKIKTLDEHLAPNNDPSKGPVISDEELKEAQQNMAGHVQSAATAIKAAGGKLPEALDRFVKELFAPKINWRDLIDDTITSCVTDDFNFMKPNRRFTHYDIFLPSLIKEETIDIAIAIDASGSINDEMAKAFISECYGASQQYKDFKISILSYDTKIYDYVEFTTDDGIQDYKLKGGGGTDFRCFFKYYKDNDITPKKLIVFTDGLDSNHDWGLSVYDNNPPFDIVWILINGNHTKVTPPTGSGSWAYYDPNDGIQEVS